MNQTLVTILGTLVPGVLIAIITAFVTVRLSLNQFREERRWEKKYESYERIMEALFHINEYNQRALSSFTSGYDIPEDDRIELTARYSAGWEELRKVMYIGGFSISDESVECLKELSKKVGETENQENDDYENLHTRVSLFTKYIDSFRECAMCDLSYKSRTFLFTKKYHNL